MLFMLTARWSDDVRRHAGVHDRPKWHYLTETASFGTVEQ
jgi:hypothetical protein